MNCCTGGVDGPLVPGGGGGGNELTPGGGMAAPGAFGGIYWLGGAGRGACCTLALLEGSSWDLTLRVSLGPVCHASSESSVTDVSTLTY